MRTLCTAYRPIHEVRRENHRGAETMRTIPAGQVRLIFWTRSKDDSPNCAGGVGSILIPAKGAINRARHLDTYGDRELCVQGGHGVTIEWPNGRTREIHADPDRA